MAGILNILRAKFNAARRNQQANPTASMFWERASKWIWKYKPRENNEYNGDAWENCEEAVDSAMRALQEEEIKLQKLSQKWFQGNGPTHSTLQQVQEAQEAVAAMDLRLQEKRSRLAALLARAERTLGDTLQQEGEWSAAVQLQLARILECMECLDTFCAAVAAAQAELDSIYVSHLKEVEGTFCCPICISDISVQHCFRISCCGHMLCRGCALEAIDSDIKAQVVPACPTCKATPCNQCPGSLQPGSGDAAVDGEACCGPSQQDLQLLLPEDMYARYVHMLAMIALQKKLFMRCQRDGCGEGVEMPPGEPHFSCPTCQFEFCINCGVPWHANSTCEQYQKWREENSKADTAFEALYDGLGKKKCPSCKNAAMKQYEHECNKVTCGFCKIKFCWVCGVQIDGYNHFNDPKSACNGKLFEGCHRG